MKQTAREKHWDLVFVRQLGCFYTNEADNSFSSACQSWYRAANSYVAQHTPDVLMIQSTFSAYDVSVEKIRAGTEAQVEQWTGKGVEVVGVRDNPRWNHSMSACEQDKGWKACSFDHIMARTDDPTQAWESRHPGYGAVDLVDLICPDGTCPAVVGNVYTYIDDNHRTGTYVASMADQFTRRFQSALDTAEAKSSASA